MEFHLNINNNDSSANGDGPKRPKLPKLIIMIMMACILFAGIARLDPSIPVLIFHTGMLMA